MTATTYRIPKFKAKLVRDGASLRVAGPTEAADALRQLCCQQNDRETFAVLYLDGCQNIIGAEVVGVGVCDAVAVSASSVMRGAIIAGARAIIVGHNHPSRRCEPSREDIETTVMLEAAATVVGLKLLDHIIVTDDGGATSLMQLGVLSVGGAP